MIGIDQMTMQDINTLNSIKEFKVVQKAQVTIMQNFMTQFIDASAHICGHCSSQIRFAHTRIKTWAQKNAQAIELRMEELTKTTEDDKD